MSRLEQLFQQFLRERTYINNVTASTLEWYRSAWKAFTAAQKAAPNRDDSGALIGKADLQGFVVHLRERGVKPVTCNTWLRAMNAFCRWLHDQDDLPAPVKLQPQRLEKRISPLRITRRSLGAVSFSTSHCGESPPVEAFTLPSTARDCRSWAKASGPGRNIAFAVRAAGRSFIWLSTDQGSSSPKP